MSMLIKIDYFLNTAALKMLIKIQTFSYDISIVYSAFKIITLINRNKKKQN